MPSEAAPMSVPNQLATCPACGEPGLDADSMFCDGCGFDLTGAGGPMVPAAAPAPPVSSRTPIRPAVLSDPALGWEVVAIPDPSLAVPGEPMPSDLRVLTFPLEGDSIVVGRYAGRADDAAVAIPDTGISRKHARLQLLEGGGLELTDLGSTNGTRVNDILAEPHVPVPISEGDRVVLGCWTRLSFRRR